MLLQKADGELTVELDGGVMTLTLNRPAQRNALTRQVSEAIAEAMDLLDERDDLAVAVLTGAGGHFCAGMDLKRFVLGERALVPGRGFGGLVEAPPVKPLIAAVEGWALAGGFELALACDLIVAARGARFGLPEVKRGLVAAAGGLVRLPRRLPHNLAMELALLGDPVGADVLQKHGVINRVVEDGTALAAAREMAAAIAANAPLAVLASKRVINESLDWPTSESFTRQVVHLEPVLTSADALEGARAFAEKRKPCWTGA